MSQSSNKSISHSAFHAPDLLAVPQGLSPCSLQSLSTLQLLRQFPWEAP